MMIAHDECQAVHRAVAELELPLQNVEDQLIALGLALHRQDADAVDRVGLNCTWPWPRPWTSLAAPRAPAACRRCCAAVWHAPAGK